MLRPAVAVPVFRDFEEPARHEIHDSVSDAELDDWVTSLALGDQFAKLVRPWGEPPVVVVQTTAQRWALHDAGVLGEWAARYHLLAQGHDEFGYLDRSRGSIGIDSIEDWRAGRGSERGYYA